MGNGSAEGQGFNIGAPMLWLDELRANDPSFTALLRERWQVLDALLDHVVEDGGVIDRMAEEIRISWQADADKWGERIASMKPLTNLEDVLHQRRAVGRGERLGRRQDAHQLRPQPGLYPRPGGDLPVQGLHPVVKTD